MNLCTDQAKQAQNKQNQAHKKETCREKLRKKYQLKYHARTKISRNPEVGSSTSWFETTTYTNNSLRVLIRRDPQKNKNKIITAPLGKNCGLKIQNFKNHFFPFLHSKTYLPGTQTKHTRQSQLKLLQQVGNNW